MTKDIEAPPHTLGWVIMKFVAPEMLLTMADPALPMRLPTVLRTWGMLLNVALTPWPTYFSSSLSRPEKVSMEAVASKKAAPTLFQLR
ncbi:hypothetical protein [Streptomyces canus]|uniref:hypothetical protein n=1 Tax=Streptomyces canus TaxID=58343 RepID=UPI0030E0336F